MNIKQLFSLLLLLAMLALVACNANSTAEPAANETPEQTPTETNTTPEATAACPEEIDGTQQLIDAAHGICLLYPDNYNVFQDNENGFTLYVDSLMNTEAPIASFTLEPANGRTIEDIVAQYLPEVDFATARFQTVGLDGATAYILDNLPGQDTNRRVITVHENMVVDIMIARIGPDYGEVGTQAEALYELITSSFRFIPVTAEMPAATATPPPTSSVDPYALARQIIEAAKPAASAAWQVAPCEGEAAVLCISDGAGNVGYAELLLFPLSGYSADHPIRAAAAGLPIDPTQYNAEQETAVRQALAALAAEYTESIAADRAVTYPADVFTPLPPEPAEMGTLPAEAFGFVRTNQAGEVMERYVNIVTFDQQFIYWFTINYDPANVSTFSSDAAVTQFEPLFYEIAANLPLTESPAAASGS